LQDLSASRVACGFRRTTGRHGRSFIGSFALVSRNRHCGREIAFAFAFPNTNRKTSFVSFRRDPAEKTGQRGRKADLTGREQAMKMSTACLNASAKRTRYNRLIYVYILLEIDYFHFFQFFFHLQKSSVDKLNIFN